MSMERNDRTARAAVFLGHGRPIELREYAVPAPRAGEVLVRVTHSTICSSDVHTWAGRRQEPVPCVLGHEITGRIEAVGGGGDLRDLRGRALALGDRVTWTIAASCGGCYFCRRGLPQKCESLFKYGHTALRAGRHFSGGFADYCLLAPGTGLVWLPDAVDDSVASTANCAVATVAAVLRSVGPVEGEVVLVHGCGVLGLMACAMARAAGAAEVVACDIDGSRGALARGFGAGHFALPGQLAGVVADLTGGRGVDFALEFSGDAESVAAGIELARVGGTCVIAGVTTPGQRVELDPQRVVQRMLTLKGVHNYVPGDLVQAVDFLADHAGGLPFAQLLGPRFRLAEIEAAFAAAAGLRGVRVSVTP